MKIADPLPGHCSVCYGAHPELRYVDFDVLFDGAPVLDRETGSIAILPWNGLMGSHDALYICEPCMKQATDLLGLKPEIHRRQLQEIRRLEIGLEHWKAYAKRLEATLEERPEPAPRAQRRKVAA